MARDHILVPFSPVYWETSSPTDTAQHFCTYMDSLTPLAHMNKMAHHGKQAYMYRHKGEKCQISPYNNARLFNFFFIETEAQGRNWTPKLCLEWLRPLGWYHRQCTPLHSWNSEEKQRCRTTAGGKKTSKKGAPCSNRLKFPRGLTELHRGCFFFF